MANESTDWSGGGDAALWSAPSGPVPDPPVHSRVRLLPIEKLHWDDVEKLYLRLLHTMVPVQYAKLYGVPGQSQDGIDAYARLPLDLNREERTGKHYVVLQSRRVKSLTATRIKKAVDDFLKGDWATKAARFYYATTYDLQEKKLDKAIQAQTERLAELGIEYVPWGIQEVSELLQGEPRLVDEFFGRAWVELACGKDAASAISHRLTRSETDELRKKLRALYGGVFSAHGTYGLSQDQGSFVILNVEPELSRAGGIEPDSPEQMAEREASHDIDEGYTFVASRLGARRRSLRSARRLLNRQGSVRVASTGEVPADEWIASGKNRLLIGAPGSGKSSLLRFIASDLLSGSPQSVAVQQAHGADLPIWLPFGFLCRHMEAATENSLVSAAKAWLTHQSAEGLVPLVEQALRDDRLFLLVDGIDEWTDAASAERALGTLEAFLGHTKVSALLSTRPYAVARLNWTLAWTRAEIAALTDSQRRTIAESVLRRAVNQDSVASVPAAPNIGVDAFIEHVSTAEELLELSRSPLFLTLLASAWRGEPLPRQRFKIYAKLVELLIEKHPQMRHRASLAQGSPMSAADVTTLLAAVAYRLRIKDPRGVCRRIDFRKLIVEALSDDEVLGYSEERARSVADAILGLAEREFGIVVSQGGGTVGFLHRVVLDHLAGYHLATWEQTEQQRIIRQFMHDPAWQDVFLATLTAQLNPHFNEQLLEAILSTYGSPWEDMDAYELLANALSADVRLTPKKQVAYADKIVSRIETHASLRHREQLVTALSRALAGQTIRRHLLPTFRKWLTAPRPDPSPSIWAMRDLEVPDDAATEVLLWGIRHPLDDVKINAAEAMARRFGGDDRLLRHVLEFIEVGPSSATQAAALLAIGHGWPAAAETAELIEWARSQPSIPVRLVGLHLLQAQASDPALYRPEERAWLLTLLEDEKVGRGPWPVAELVNIAASGDTRVADFALETLKTNGETGGDRNLSWYLACNAFAGDDRFKQWVASELSQPGQPLILYNVGMIPESWRDDPEFATGLKPYVSNEMEGFTSGAVAGLAGALGVSDTLTALLKGLNASRPYAAARALADEYLDDERARNALVDRLRGVFESAAPMAEVAMAVLGRSDGFALLVDLLRQTPSTSRHEGKVVVAQATAEGWITLKGVADDATSPTAKEAVDILSSYDAAELAALCTAVDPNVLMWHVPAVINAWPEQPTVQRFASALLFNTRPIAHGISDSIPAAILRAYCGRNDDASRAIVATAMSLLRHLEPELREVIAYELVTSTLPVRDLLETIDGWKDEPDTEVRRTLLIGAAQAIIKDQQAHSAAGETDGHLAWLRDAIKDQLIAYGPELEERRRLAWIGMLMVGDFSLIDDLKEYIGEPGRPGVELSTDFGKAFDPIAVDLVAANWNKLTEHFGEEVYSRLKGKLHGRDRNEVAQRRHVLAALSTVASRYPNIAELLRTEADHDPDLRSNPYFLLWAKEFNRGDAATLSAMIDALTQHQPYENVEPVVEAILDRESWQVADDTFKSLLIGICEREFEPEIEILDIRKALFCQLFPDDPISQSFYMAVKTWFEEGRRQRLEWSDLLALCLGVAKAQHLPVIASRIHARFQMGLPDWFLPLFTKPLVRRLMTDTHAAEIFRAALSRPMDIDISTPLFSRAFDPIGAVHKEFLVHQRTYLYALALQRAGTLTFKEANDAVNRLNSAEATIVVHNPFTDAEGPLRLLALDVIAPA